MLQSVSTSGAQVATSGASHEIADAWRSKVLPLCDAAFDRYPFVASSTPMCPVDDFARLLAPGGLMSQFFDQYLKSFVDTAQRPWRWLSPDQTPLGLSPGIAGRIRTGGPDRQRFVPQRQPGPGSLPACAGGVGSSGRADQHRHRRQNPDLEPRPAGRHVIPMARHRRQDPGPRHHDACQWGTRPGH